VKTGMAASLWLITTLCVVGTSVAQNAPRIPYSGIRCPDSERLKQYIAYIQGGLDPEHAVAKVTACRLGEVELKLDMQLVDAVTDLNGTYQIYSAVMTITYDPVTCRRTEVRPAQEIFVMLFRQPNRA
jgi:hypothetical protein